MYPHDEAIKNDPFEGEEIANLKTLMDQIDAQGSEEEYVSCDDNTWICAGLIDPSSLNWRKEVRSRLLNDDLDIQFIAEGTLHDVDH